MGNGSETRIHRNHAPQQAGQEKPGSATVSLGVEAARIRLQFFSFSALRKRARCLTEASLGTSRWDP